MIETMDRNALRLIEQKMKAAMDEAADELGVKVTWAGGKYDPTVGTFTPKITFSLSDAERKEFERCARLWGVDPEDYGREFTSQGKTFKLVGINSRAPKFPFLAKNVRDGRTYKFQESAVLRALGKDA